MGLFDRLERKLEQSVNGAFAKAFRSEVQPVEIASALRRAMDDRATSVGKGHRPIVPNLFAIELSPTDFDRLTAYEEQLTDELVASAAEHAETQRYRPGGPLDVTFSESEDLETGVFRVRPSIAKQAGGTYHRPPQPARYDDGVGARHESAGRGGEYAPHGEVAGPGHLRRGGTWDEGKRDDGPRQSGEWDDRRHGYPQDDYARPRDRSDDSRHGYQRDDGARFRDQWDENQPGGHARLGDEWEDDRSGYGRDDRARRDDPGDPRDRDDEPRYGGAAGGLGAQWREPEQHHGDREPLRPSPAAPRRVRARPWLEIDGDHYPLVGAITVIGRDDDADIVLDDPGISRRHCEIRTTTDGPHLIITLHDLGSTNGTFVAGRRVDRARLQEADRVTVGRTDLIVHEGGHR